MILGDFELEKDEIIQMHGRLDQTDGFLSRDDKEMYELDHGFKFNNAFFHGRQMIVDHN